MEISVSDAKAQLTELVRRAEAGDENVQTRHGHPAARLVAIKKTCDRTALRALVEEIWAMAKPIPGPSAARSQDFLYDEDGLPR